MNIPLLCLVLCCVQEAAKQPLVSDKYIYLYWISCCKSPNKRMYTRWSVLLDFKSTDHLCNILWGFCQWRRSRWRVDAQSFCRLSHCPDSRFQGLFSFFGEGFPGCPSRCQHMLVPDGWCSPSCTSGTHMNRAAEERPRRRGMDGRGHREDGATGWGRGWERKKAANAAADGAMMTGGKGVQLGWRLWHCCGWFVLVRTRTDRRRWPPCA